MSGAKGVGVSCDLLGRDLGVRGVVVPDMVQAALRARGRDVEVVRPPISFRRGLSGTIVLFQLRGVAKQLGVPLRRTPTRLPLAPADAS